MSLSGKRRWLHGTHFPSSPLTQSEERYSSFGAGSKNKVRRRARESVIVFCQCFETLKALVRSFVGRCDKVSSTSSVYHTISDGHKITRDSWKLTMAKKEPTGSFLSREFSMSCLLLVSLGSSVPRMFRALRAPGKQSASGPLSVTAAARRGEVLTMMCAQSVFACLLSKSGFEGGEEVAWFDGVRGGRSSCERYLIFFITSSKA